MVELWDSKQRRSQPKGDVLWGSDSCANSVIICILVICISDIFLLSRSHLHAPALMPFDTSQSLFVSNSLVTKQRAGASLWRLDVTSMALCTQVHVVDLSALRHVISLLNSLVFRDKLWLGPYLVAQNK